MIFKYLYLWALALVVLFLGAGWTGYVGLWMYRSIFECQSYRLCT